MHRSTNGIRRAAKRASPRLSPCLRVRHSANLLSTQNSIFERLLSIATSCFSSDLPDLPPLVLTGCAADSAGLGAGDEFNPLECHLPHAAIYKLSLFLLRRRPARVVPRLPQHHAAFTERARLRQVRAMSPLELYHCSAAFADAALAVVTLTNPVIWMGSCRLPE